MSNTVFGQQINFRGFPVDTISISSSSGCSSFDHKGTWSGSDCFYIIAFDKTTNNYLVADFMKVSLRGTIKPQTITRKIKHSKQEKGKEILNADLETLFSAFNLKCNKSTFENSGYDKQKFLSLTDDRHILKVANEYKQDWHFRKSYSSKEESKKIFDGCQNIDTFNLFLASKFDTSSYVIVTDVWDKIEVRIVTASKSFLFEGKYPNPFRQPWYDESAKIPASIVNLNINKSLALILPERFYGRNSLVLRELTYQYIKWYLQRRKIIDNNL
jgi:hypothetical protein